MYSSKIKEQAKTRQREDKTRQDRTWQQDQTRHETKHKTRQDRTWKKLVLGIKKRHKTSFGDQGKFACIGKLIGRH